MYDLCAENKIWRELVLGRGKGLSRGSSVSQRKQVIGPHLFFFFFFRAQGLGNATIAVKTSQWTVDVGPLNGGSLICPLLVLKEVSFIR